MRLILSKAVVLLICVMMVGQAPKPAKPRYTLSDTAPAQVRAVWDSFRSTLEGRINHLRSQIETNRKDHAVFRIGRVDPKLDADLVDYRLGQHGNARNEVRFRSAKIRKAYTESALTKIAELEALIDRYQRGEAIEYPSMMPDAPDPLWTSLSEGNIGYFDAIAVLREDGDGSVVVNPYEWVEFKTIPTQRLAPLIVDDGRGSPPPTSYTVRNVSMFQSERYTIRIIDAPVGLRTMVGQTVRNDRQPYELVAPNDDDKASGIQWRAVRFDLAKWLVEDTSPYKATK
jgi:hypothetical protein